eukprot:3201077-Pleurochrysis_carterae.AAC.2
MPSLRLLLCIAFGNGMMMGRRQMLAQLEERGLVKKLGEAVGNLVARADKVRPLIERSRWHS